MYPWSYSISFQIFFSQPLHFIQGICQLILNIFRDYRNYWFCFFFFLGLFFFLLLFLGLRGSLFFWRLSWRNGSWWKTTFCGCKFSRNFWSFKYTIQTESTLIRSQIFLSWLLPLNFNWGTCQLFRTIWNYWFYSFFFLGLFLFFCLLLGLRGCLFFLRLSWRNIIWWKKMFWWWKISRNINCLVWVFKAKFILIRIISILFLFDVRWKLWTLRRLQ